MTETTEIVMRLKGFVPCPWCFGPGQVAPTNWDVPDNMCSTCDATGWITKEENERQYDTDLFIPLNASYSEVRGRLAVLFNNQLFSDDKDD